MRSGTNPRIIDHVDAPSGTRLLYCAFDTHRGGRDEFITISADFTQTPGRVVERAREFLKEVGASPATELRASVALRLTPGPDRFLATEAAIEALRSLPTMPGPVIAVAADPAAWRGVRGFDGFVVAQAGTERRTTEALGTLLSALSAPTMLSCVDDGDLLTVVGPTDAPGRLVEAVWRPSGNDGEGKLDLDDEGARILRSARGICLLPVVRLLRMDAYRAMAASVRSEWAPKADLFSIVTVEFFPAPLERAPSNDSIRVLALCL